MADEFTINTQIVGRVAMLDISGFLEATANDLLAVRLEEALAGGYTRIVIDFSACKVLSSPGIHALIQFALKLEEVPGGRLVLAGANALQVKVFTLVGLDTVAVVATDRIQGLAEAEKV